MKLEKARELISQALKAREHSYCPYSNFAVGAALLCDDGTVYTGCNVETAAFNGCCAERTAIFSAVADGHRNFAAIAVAGAGKDQEPNFFCTPCGVCRQVMREFTDPGTFKIILAKSLTEYREFTLEQLLPMGFGPENLL